jgi:hypothetical protein
MTEVQACQPTTPVFCPSLLGGPGVSSRRLHMMPDFMEQDSCDNQIAEQSNAEEQSGIAGQNVVNYDRNRPARALSMIEAPASRSIIFSTGHTTRLSSTDRSAVGQHDGVEARQMRARESCNQPLGSRTDPGRWLVPDIRFLDTWHPVGIQSRAIHFAVRALPGHSIVFCSVSKRLLRRL